MSLVLEGIVAQGRADIGSFPRLNKKGELKGSTLVFVRLLMKASLCKSGNTKACLGHRVYFMLLSVRPK